MKTINKFVLILLLSLPALCLFAQSDLSSRYRGPKADIKTFVQRVQKAGRLIATGQTVDGSYITISRISATRFLVKKIKESAQKQWETTLDFHVNQGNTLAHIEGIAQTTDGGFVLAGEVATDCDYLPFDCGPIAATLVKLRPNGSLQWKKSLVGADGYFFTSVISKPDGGVIAIGGLRDFYGDPAKNELLIVRFTAFGDVIWKKSLKGPGGIPWGLQATPLDLPLIGSAATTDNGLIVAYPSTDGVDVKKITDLGSVAWKKSLKVNSFLLQSMGRTTAGGVILAGIGSNQLKVVVLNPDGTLGWKAGYSLKVPGRITLVSNPVQTPDGGYLITGSGHHDSGGIFDFGFVAKIDSARNIEFQNTIGETYGYGATIGVSIFATEDGGFVVFGSDGYLKDIYFLKLNSEGIAPGCATLVESHQFGSTTRDSFGLLKIAGVNVAESNQFSLEPFEFGLSSVVTNHPVSTLCQ